MPAPRKLNDLFYTDLIGQIYAAALNPPGWRDVVNTLAQVYPDARIALFAHRNGRPSQAMTLHHNFDEADLRAYVDYYVTNSPHVKHVDRLIVGRPTLSEEYVSVEELKRTEHYNDYVRPRRLGYHATGVLLERRPDGLTALSFADREDNARRRAHQMRLLNVISPHVLRAISLSRTTAQRRVAADATAGMFNLWASAAFVLDGEGRMVTMNDAAVELLDNEDCIALDRTGALRSFDVGVSRGLEAAIRGCLDVRDKLDPTMCRAHRDGISLPRRTPGPALQAMVWPLPFVDEHSAFGAAPGRVLMMIFDPGQPHRMGVGWIARRFGLTAKEDALLESLVNGSTLAQAAEMAGIRLSTARTQLKRIQFKTGCSRQVDLVRLALSRPTIRQN